VVFRHKGKQHVLILGRISETEAKAKASQVDYLLMRLKQVLIVVHGQLPEGERLSMTRRKNLKIRW